MSENTHRPSCSCTAVRRWREREEVALPSLHDPEGALRALRLAIERPEDDLAVSANDGIGRNIAESGTHVRSAVRGESARRPRTGNRARSASGSTVCTQRRNGLERIRAGGRTLVISSGSCWATSSPVRSRPRLKSLERSRIFFPARACLRTMNWSTAAIENSRL